MSETPVEKPAKKRFEWSPEPKRKGRGGKPGNSNRLRHGMKGSKLPPDCKYIQLRCNKLRQNVEQALLAAKGEIGIVDAATINSVYKWERHGMLAAHWLRKEADNLSVSERLRFSEAIAKASDNRDKALRSLNLDAPPEAPWADPAALTAEVEETPQ